MNRYLIEKEKEAIERLKAFEPEKEPYYLCYSGGKDSDVIRILATLAGVKHEIHHNLTTVDAPETVAYIKTIKGVHINKARYPDGTPKTMWNLMPKKRMPPTRIARWCCSELKEQGGKGRLKITGVRWEESTNRRANADVIRVVGKPTATQKILENSGLSYTVTKSGGIVLNAQCGDNETVRDKKDFVHHCYIDRSVTINPIVEWSTRDVWEFLHHYGVRSNPLYQCGENRIGCIGCPLSGTKSMKSDFAKYPKYYESYIRSFKKMIDERKRLKLPTQWESGIDVMKWWLGENPDQLTLFDENELYEAMQEV
ncbi:MAG: phosphoadenosine phosphosulfate reductase family protein [Salinivirgaceae bacterium]|nr:phosphoadenosine phosphosulfate reductase family protein [Salinivirgaceae bacterium]